MTTNRQSTVKRVLFLCDFFSSLGGTEKYNATLARGLRDKGIEVRIYVGEKPKLTSWKDQLIDDGFFFSAPSKFHTDLASNEIEKDFMNNIIDEINKWKPDIIHVHPFRKLAIQWLANERADHSIPIVATEWTVPSINSSHWFENNTPAYINQINTYIATCHAITQGIRKYHSYSGPIVEIPHIIKSIPANRAPHTPNTLNSIGCISRLSTEKGLVFLLGAWKQVVDHFPGKKLFIYGHGPDQDNLQLLRDCLGLQNSVIFAGTYRPEDVHKIAAKHSIFVQPSLFESIPTSIIEIMLNGRVVVASNVGGISELVNDSVNGIIASPGSTDEIAKGIISLLSSPEKIESLSQRAFDDSRGIYDYELTMQKIINLYEILKKSPHHTQ